METSVGQQQADPSSIPSSQEVKWPDKKDAVDLFFEGECVPATREEALRLVQQRFGCAYRMLSEAFRSDREIMMEAAVGSAGHTLADVPEQARQTMDPAFVAEAMERGVMFWAIEKYVPQPHRDHPDVLARCAEARERIQSNVKNMQQGTTRKESIAA